jgi:hypothetical protein
LTILTERAADLQIPVLEKINLGELRKKLLQKYPSGKFREHEIIFFPHKSKPSFSGVPFIDIRENSGQTRRVRVG